MAHTKQSRIALILCSLCLAYVAVLSKLYYVQIYNATFFTQLAAQQYHVTVRQTPPRGPILDRTGKHFLAMNKECTSAFIVPNALKQPERLDAFLAEHFPHAHERMARNTSKSFMYLKRRLSAEQLNLIQAQQLPDIHLLRESRNFYPTNFFSFSANKA